MIIYKSHPESCLSADRFISGSSKDSDPDESGRNNHKTKNLEGFLIIFLNKHYKYNLNLAEVLRNLVKLSKYQSEFGFRTFNKEY